MIYGDHRPGDGGSGDHLVLGVTVDGGRDILGLSAREHGDGLRQVLTGVLAGIKNCGTQDVCMLVCGGLNGLPDVVGAVWEKTIAPTCIVHLLRNTFTYAPRILSAARQGPQAGLERRVRNRSAGPVRRIQREMGEALPEPSSGSGRPRGRVTPARR